MCTNSWGSEAPPQRLCTRQTLGGPRPNPKGCAHTLGVPRPHPKGCVHTLGGLSSGENLGVLGGLDAQFHEILGTTVGDPLTPTHPQGCVQTAGGQWTHPKGCA
eukprot:scaffold98683_cov47-Phaeocystis_antarctica.AAC.1